MTRASDTARLVSGGAVFNEASNDVDFRVETNAESNAFLVDAGNENINFFTSSAISTGSNSGTGVTIKNNGRIVIQTDDAVDAELTASDQDWLKRKLKVAEIGENFDVSKMKKIVAGKKLWNYDNLEPTEKKGAI